MTKKEIISQIDLAALHGRSYLNDRLRSNRTFVYHDYNAENLSVAAAYNLCAGSLARAIGIASLLWDKPAQLAQAA